MRYQIDSKFKSYFSNIKQVFLYVINDCNLSCPQCIYKTNIYFNIGEKQIPFETASDLLETFFSLGATKLTLLGGEPSMYGKNDDKKMGDLVKKSKELGYSYVRIDTNGTFDDNFLADNDVRLLDEISFSIDGFDAESNDKIRGTGNFDIAINRIKQAISLGYNVNITTCLYEELLMIENNQYRFERLIFLAQNLGVKRINFHALIKDGTPIDLWSSDLQVQPKQWINCYKTIRDNIEKNKYKIDVRMPQAFVSKEEFDNNPSYYGFCPAKLGERVLVHPDGLIRICSGLLGTAYSVASYINQEIKWNYGLTNELREHHCEKMTPCTNRSKRDFGSYVPLCFSFKPHQSEFVYNNILRWDEKIKK